MPHLTKEEKQELKRLDRQNELDLVEEIMRKQAYNSKDDLGNSKDLLIQLEVRRRMQAKWNMQYQKSEKYKSYKREYMKNYMKKQKLDKFKDTINKYLISNQVNKTNKKINLCDNIRLCKKIFISQYGLTDYDDYIRGNY